MRVVWEERKNQGWVKVSEEKWEMVIGILLWGRDAEITCDLIQSALNFGVIWLSLSSSLLKKVRSKKFTLYLREEVTEGLDGP